MKWQDMLDEHKQEAAELIGTIDSGERWIFEHSEKDSDFHEFVCNKTLVMENVFGIISAAYYRDCQRISIAFNVDLPRQSDAEEITAETLTNIVKGTELNTFIWCKNENKNLRRIIEDTFDVELNYASHEMCISKAQFKDLKSPTLPSLYRVCGFDATRHDEYINLLEQGMKHVSQAGTTPYLDRSDSLKLHFAERQRENRFHAIWCSNIFVGICYSDGGEIDTLVVNENHRCKGIGYYLLYIALQNAFIYHDGDICLYVVDHNRDAFEFYKRCGMRVTGHSARYFIDRSTKK